MNAVCNASPFIALYNAGLSKVLDDLFDRVVLPDAVVTEVRAGGSNDSAAMAVDRLLWLEHVSLSSEASPFSVVSFGAGEAETIEWALRHPEFVALLDDRAARRTAEALGVRCAGTLRVLYEAHHQNLVESFYGAVDDVRKVGLYCDERVIEQLKQEDPYWA